MGEDEVNDQILHWITTWMNAADRQVRRIERASYENMEPDAFLYVQAVYNVRRGAEQILAARHPAIQDFDKQWPHLKNLRDMAEHFDDYARGSGRRQKKREMRYPAPFRAVFQKSISQDFKYATIFLADSYIEIHRCLEAAAILGLASRLKVAG